LDAAIAAFAGLLEKFGWPGALLVVVIVGFWRVCSFLSVKFFNEELDNKGEPKGYVPIVVKGHRDMLEAVKTSLVQRDERDTEILSLQKEHLALSKDHRADIKELIEWHKVHPNPHSLVEVNTPKAPIIGIAALENPR